MNTYAREKLQEACMKAESQLNDVERQLLERIVPLIEDYTNVDISGTLSEKALLDVVRQVAGMNSHPSDRELAALAVARFNIAGWIKEPDDYEPVYPYRGMMYINPFLGCNYGCIYCYRNDHAGKTKDWYLLGKPVKTMSAREAIDRLVSHPWFLPNRTQIGLHTSTTDPFIPTVKETTFELIEEMQHRGLANDLIIVSKYYLDEDDVRRLDSFTNNRILLFLTYTAHTAEVEPLGNKPQIKALRWKTRDYLARAKHVKWGHFYRPIIESWNDTEEQIREALEYGEPSGVSILGGLKLIDGLDELAKDRHLPIPRGDFRDRGFKFLAPSTLEKITALHRKYKFNSRLVGDQSCGITILLGRHGQLVPNVEGLRMYDDNASETGELSRPDNNLDKGCMECSVAQLEVCRRGQTPAPNREDISWVLGNFGVEYDEFQVTPRGVFVTLTNGETSLSLPVRMGIASALRYAVYPRKDVAL